MCYSRKKTIVAIDGPAGSGKTTVAKIVADRLGYRLVDTGALYRCLAFSAVMSNTSVHDEERLAELAVKMSVRFEKRPQGQVVFLDGQDVTERIREPDISQLASQVSIHPLVRTNLLAVQRGLGEQGGAVFEGRDIGTVVFPDAEVKVFLLAPAELRAKRRFQELREKGCPVELAKTLEELSRRDQRDASREVAPLTPAHDAVLIDTAESNASQVAQRVIDLVEVRLKSPRGES